jgi:hypothetical protein
LLPEYLRDNDPDHMGHNTSFLTRVAENVIYILNDAQLTQLADLSVAQEEQFNLYASATSSIVKMRTDIDTLLRDLMTSTDSSDSIKAQVLELSGTYGDLDGENNYNYAIVFAQFYNTLSDYQKTQLAALRKSIMSGKYSDGTAFDFSVCETPFLYSSVITDLSLLDPYIDNTDYLFF